jgi:hypothetical protein
LSLAKDRRLNTILSENVSERTWCPANSAARAGANLNYDVIEAPFRRAVGGENFLRPAQHPSRRRTPLTQHDEGPVAVVSHGFWRKRLASDPAALGRTLQAKGRL